LKRRELYDSVWQAFAVVGDDEAVGVLGDQRKLGHIVTVRIVKSLDGMTADWARVPEDVLEEISNRITGEVPGVTWLATLRHQSRHLQSNLAKRLGLKFQKDDRIQNDSGELVVTWA